MLAAFQLNRASLVKDILSDESAVPHMEHFQRYKPEFNNGFNTKEALFFDGIYIYLNSSDQANVYHSKSSKNPYHPFVTIPCVYIDEQYYIPLKLYKVNTDGKRYDSNISWDLGKYYDAMMEIMVTGKYSKTEKNGSVSHYGLFEITEFVNEIIKE